MKSMKEKLFRKGLCTLLILSLFLVYSPWTAVFAEDSLEDVGPNLTADSSEDAALRAAKDKAQSELDAYGKKYNLGMMDQISVFAAVTSGKIAIENCESESQVKKELKNAKKEIDKIKIDSVKDLKVESFKVNLGKNYKTVKASWKEIENVEGYRVYYKKSSAKKWSYSDTSKTSFSKELKAGTKYKVKVKPYVKANNKKHLSKATPVTKSTRTLKKTTASLSRKSTSSIKISWKNIEGETGYQIYRSTSKNKGFSKAKIINSAKAKSWTDTKKIKGKTYYYKVRAYKSVNGKYVYAPFSAVKGIKR